ncbi:MAG: host attachment protein [Hyphomicrobiaceae bacterium]|nr:host attachment protein [Hyphomicrobiaceae bacterium]
MKLAQGMWVAVVDGAKGLILVNEGTAFEPKLSVVRQYNQDNPPTRDQGRDRPGRMNDTGGQHKSSVEMPDHHQRAEDRFVAEVMSDLEKDAAAGAFDKLVLAAPPVALGTVRKQTGPALKDRIVLELAADYVKMPVPDIAKVVAKALEG